jgi:uncharacterized protein with LGFP repeats
MRWALELPSTWFGFQPTPIQRTWQRLGGAKSRLGRTASPQRSVTSKAGRDGVTQAFARGRMYWSSPTGAHALLGPVLTAYQRQGGLKSRLGYPTTHSERTVDDRGRRAIFQRGLVVWSKRTGARTLSGKILRAYARHHYVQGPLGYPTTDIHRVKKGKRAKFQHGTITWVRASGRTTVQIRR